MNNSEAILLAARTLITDKKHWTQHSDIDLIIDYETADEKYGDHYANVDGNFHPSDCAFCATGAVRFVASGLGFRTEDIAMNRLNEAAEELFGEKIREVSTYELSCSSAINVNDHFSHKDTLKMFDRAIELAGSQRAR